MPLINDGRTFQIAILPGDGQGPQLASYVEKTLNLIQHVRPDVSFKISKHDFGGAALASGAGTTLPPTTLSACQQSDATIICGCGDPKYGFGPEEGLLTLRREMNACVNIRPVKFPSTQLAHRSSYKSELVENLDINFFRDLTGGIYYGPRMRPDKRAKHMTRPNTHGKQLNTLHD